MATQNKAGRKRIIKGKKRKIKAPSRTLIALLSGKAHVAPALPASLPPFLPFQLIPLPQCQTPDERTNGPPSPTNEPLPNQRTPSPTNETDEWARSPTNERDGTLAPLDESEGFVVSPSLNRGRQASRYAHPKMGAMFWRNVRGNGGQNGCVRGLP